MNKTLGSISSITKTNKYKKITTDIKDLEKGKLSYTVGRSIEDSCYWKQ
jgi:hypothetical protein